MTLLKVGRDTTREQLEEAMLSLSKAAKREQAIVRRYACDDFTPWDHRHEGLDDLLERWEVAGR